MNIKQAAEQSGVSARNIRYYEQAGLLTPARNPENEYRIYSQADVRALKLIRMLRTLDMPVEEISTVLNGTLPLAEAAERQRQRLEAEQQKLAAAAAFCTELIIIILRRLLIDFQKFCLLLCFFSHFSGIFNLWKFYSRSVRKML